MAAANRVTARQKLKLLFILDEFADPHAGTEGQFLLLLSLLDRTRIEPAIWLLRGSACLQSAAAGVPVTVLDVRRLRSVVGVWRILKAAWRARRAGFRVAHIFFNDSAIVFPAPLKLCGIKVIVSRRDLGFWYTRWNLPILRAAARFVDAVVVNSQAVRDVVVCEEGYRPADIEVIHNGIRRDDARGTPLCASDLGVVENARVIVCVANLRPLKRIADVIRALPAVRSSAGPAHLIVIGEDRPGDQGPSHQAELEALAGSLQVRDYVHFTGRMEDPMPVIALADVCVLCSQTEGLSNAIIEYMFAAKPTVCTRVGGNGEIVVDGQTGSLVEVGDVAHIARAIGAVLLDPALAAGMGRAARERAVQLFAPRVMVERHMRLYESLAASGADRHGG